MLIVDDDKQVRDALAELMLSADLETACFGSTRELLEAQQDRCDGSRNDEASAHSIDGGTLAIFPRSRMRGSVRPIPDLHRSPH